MSHNPRVVIRWAILFALIATAMSAAGTEWPISTVAPAPVAAGLTPAIATDGQDYLVVSRGYAIVATRVSGGGEVLDPIPLTITTAYSDVPPAVAWNGRDYVVVWNDRLDSQIWVARVTPQGNVAERRAIVDYLPPLASGTEDRVAIAWNGGQLLIAYSLYHSISALILDDDLNVIVPDVPIARTQGWIGDGVAVSTDGTNFLVVWNGDTQSTLGAIVRPDGSNLGITIAASSTTNNLIVFDGVSWIIASAAVGWPPGSPQLVRIARDGTIMARVTVPPVSALVSSDGEASVFSVDSKATVTAQRLDSNLVAVGAPVVIADHVSGFGISPDARLVTWVTSTDRIFRVALLHDDLTTGTAIAAASGASYQTAPAISRDPDGWFAAWSEYRPFSTAYGPFANSDLYVGHLTAEGVPATGNGIRIATGLRPTSWNSTAVQVSTAFNGIAHLVVWEEGAQQNCRVKARRFSTSAVPLDTADIVIDEGAQTTASLDSPVVASDGRDWVVAWQAADGSGQIRIRRVRANGTLDDASTITVGPQRHQQPAIAFDGSMYWIGWVQLEPGILHCPFECPLASQGDVYAGRFAADGRPLDAPGGIAIAVDPDDQESISIAANGDGAIVTWMSQPLQDARYSVRSSAVSRNGELLDGTPQQNGHAIWTGSANFFGVAPGVVPIAWNASAYTIAWPVMTTTGIEIHRATLDAQASIVQSDTIALRFDGRADNAIVLSRDSLCIAGDHAYLAYVRLGIERPYGAAPRAFLRDLDAVPRSRPVRR